MNDALWIPDNTTNILAVQNTARRGATFTFGKDNNVITLQDGTKFEMFMHDRLYYLPFQDSFDAMNRVLDLNEWHEIYGHCNMADIRKLAKHNLVTGMQLHEEKSKHNESQQQCETCIMNKLPNFRNHAPRTKSEQALQLVHSDLTGPINPVGKHSFKYAMNFVDDFSGFTFLYMLRSKADATTALKQFLVDAKQFGQVQTIRTDNGTEYTCKSFEDVLRDAGIKHEFSAPYSSHQNGTAERNWRTIFGMARCMLNEQKLPKSLWPYAVMHAAFIRNRCLYEPTEQTPYFSLTGFKPDVSKLQKFGANCLAFDQSASGKLDPRWQKGIFVGFDRRSPASFVYLPEKGSVLKF
jgi:transposase InsO family protein